MMLFVPLPLFATIFLFVLLGRILMTRDMSLQAHQLFAGLMGLYAVQSLLASLRWGYAIEGAAVCLIILAPVLPALAYLAYTALADRTRVRDLWPLGVVLMNWLAFAFLPFIPDALILITYLGFGFLLLRFCMKGPDALARSPINDAGEIRIAIGLTGAALVASGLTDVYLIYDFVQNEGRNAGLILTFVQTLFVVVIGLCASFGHADAQSELPEIPVTEMRPATDQDGEIVRRLEELFTTQGLHKNEDLSLRRLARRLGVPDRQVSNAVNRARGVSVSQYVNDFRIQEACALLRDTEKSVLEVSLAAGFATKSNFNREFLRVAGLSPSKWRQKHAE